MLDLIINLTPHNVTVVSSDSAMQILAEFPASGNLARVKATSFKIGKIGGIPLVRTIFSDVDGLPAPDGRTRYIVSAMVMSAVQRAGNRTTADLLSPDQFVRNGAGEIIACRALRMAS